jgi:hypothetical protein
MDEVAFFHSLPKGMRSKAHNALVSLVRLTDDMGDPVLCALKGRDGSDIPAEEGVRHIRLGIALATMEVGPDATTWSLRSRDHEDSATLLTLTDASSDASDSPDTAESIRDALKKSAERALRVIGKRNNLFGDPDFIMPDGSVKGAILDNAQNALESASAILDEGMASNPETWITITHPGWDDTSGFATVGGDGMDEIVMPVADLPKAVKVNFVSVDPLTLEMVPLKWAIADPILLDPVDRLRALARLPENALADPVNLC